jgi:hypothetical protein
MRSNRVMLLVVFKLVYLGGLLFLLKLYPLPRESAFTRHSTQAYDRQDMMTIKSHFLSWDASYYLQIAECGYLSQDRSSAFFPLFPFCLRALIVCTNIPFWISGLLFANLTSIFAWVVFWRLVERRMGENALIVHSYC